MSIQQAIQERSYFLWEGEGRPHGRSLDHWLTAEAELSVGGESKPKTVRAKRVAPGPAKPAVKRAAAKRPAPRDA